MSAAASLWGHAARRVRRDRTALAALAVVVVYIVTAAGVAAGWWGQEWQKTGAELYAGPSAEHWLGTNSIGQDVFQRTVYSTKTAFEVGGLVAVLSTLFGAVLGALSGFFSLSWVDELILWLKGVIDSIPIYLFAIAIDFALQATPLAPVAMHLAMVLVFWTTTARLVRGEVIRLKEMEFVQAATAIGLPRLVTLFRHIVPSTTPILLVQATITFVAAVKTEVVLSFLGIGVKQGVSWGVMIQASTQEVTGGHYANFLSASAALFVLVMAFNLFSDALQDALDPKAIA